jgi:hypothetical protein
VKCSICSTPLDPRHVYMVAAFTTERHVLNLHPLCLRDIVGRRAWDALTRAVYRSGWHQLELPP